MDARQVIDRLATNCQRFERSYDDRASGLARDMMAVRQDMMTAIRLIENQAQEIATLNAAIEDLRREAAEDRDFAQVTIRQLDVDELYVIPWEET